MDLSEFPPANQPTSIRAPNPRDKLLTETGLYERDLIQLNKEIFEIYKRGYRDWKNILKHFKHRPRQVKIEEAQHAFQIYEAELFSDLQDPHEGASAFFLEELGKICIKFGLLKKRFEKHFPKN